MITSTKNVFARVPADLHRKMRIRALEEGRSVSEVIEALVRAYVGEKPPKEKRSA